MESLHISLSSPKRFGDRKVQEWVTLAETGVLALPSFQRSYVWKRPQAIAEYLLAVFENRPTGVFLVLKTSADPQFKSRTLKGIEADTDKAVELLLDGQQRLTSLWSAFNGSAPVSYYLRIENLIEGPLTLTKVEFSSERSSRGKALAQPEQALRENLVPLDILRDEPLDDLGPIWRWCISATSDADRAQKLSRRLTKFGTQLLGRDLHYCELGAETTRREAIDIFVQSNKSSVRVNEFDIAVALAEEEADLHLRDVIGEFHQNSDVTRHYVGGTELDNEEALSRLGEWALFTGCIAEKDMAPKRSRFEKVVKDVLAADTEDSENLLGHLLRNVESALNTIAEHGARTKQTLPALPPLHVLAALQKHLGSLKKAAAQALGNRLISAYVWRSFFTNRYEANANDRLFEDFVKLRTCIKTIEKTGKLVGEFLPPIFNLSDYPLPTIGTLSNLEDPVPWIKSASRLGRAVAALQLERDPTDWITGLKLNTIRVRELEGQGKLDRHHVFPKQVLQGLLSKDQIDHALNGVLLGKSSNQALSKKDPSDYLKDIARLPSMHSEDKLRQFVESHLVPYDVLLAQGNLKIRYKNFVKERAKLVAARIREVCALPETA